MHWPSRKSEQPTTPSTSSTSAPGTSSPPPAHDAGPAFSAPPPSDLPPVRGPPKAVDYDAMDFSKYTSSVYESDGLEDREYARRERAAATGQWITNPRARQCVASIQLGAKMGGAVGGVFGLLTGLVVSVTQRNILILPVSVIGGAVSFGFFLGCGMIIRCEERVDGGGVIALPDKDHDVVGQQAFASRRQWESPSAASCKLRHGCMHQMSQDVE
mmetsp:Transcript_54322/g.100339  ORF Transcript_54322/g.100339 Transcript_54322/m.100339 type:complete len:215 (+) Transcript_54322:89-733(+)